MKSIRSASSRTPAMLNPYQPSAHATTRRSAASLLPPRTIGIPVLPTGFGLTRTESKLTNSPVNDATSSRHTVRIAATYSAVRAARRSNGTPSASNSSRDHPMPTPSVNRPPHNVSSVAACLATTTGLCSGSSSTPVARRIDEVAAAAKLNPIIGSIQSAVDGTAICPSSEYGYRDADRSTITTCSPDHRVANPARSAAWATTSMTARSAPVPMPRACNPSRIRRSSHAASSAMPAMRSAMTLTNSNPM